ncbi:transcriptional regulator [Kutzneria sp. 744]|uniref:ArsR/SmtB family transcription factor n=1 Tax=Kutzneria sp. (strain 744) TaxID=345341 RepID=UPI0003EEB298|nr:helix-turn-helix domain-containing protein [Kutzneria sp. 744]EWM15013.1 ArsR-family transcriptional regulator [Kutzneria sp. 744]
MPEPRPADLGALKALANPLRQRILEQLSRHGPATSTTLARELGVTSGGTSYNLRVLAEHGFVEEVPERAHGRERWWRHVPHDLRLGARSAQDPETRTVAEELLGQWIAADVEEFRRFQAARDQLGEWADAMPFSRGSILVDLDELKSFFEDYLALLRRYSRDPGEAAAGARTVLTRFLAFPAPTREEMP